MTTDALSSSRLVGARRFLALPAAGSMAFALVAVLALGSLATTDGRAATSQGRRREVVIDPTDKTKTYTVRPGPGDATTIALPEGWLRISCGRCVVGDAEYQGQLWRLDLFPETHELSIKLAKQPERQPRPLEYHSNLDITLEGGVSISIDLNLEVDDPSAVDLRVDMTMPERWTLKARLSAREKELEQRFGARVEEAAAARVDELVMGSVRCRDFSGRPTRSEAMVVRLRQICRMGADLFVTFDVENRRQADLQLLSATLVDGDGAESATSRFQKPVAAWKERVVGVVRFPLHDANAPLSTYTLTVAEDGGKSRVDVVEGIGL